MMLYKESSMTVMPECAREDLTRNEPVCSLESGSTVVDIWF